MILYPYVEERYQSPLAPAELLARLQLQVSNVWFEFNGKKLKGRVYPNGFTLRRLNWFTHVSSRPIILGRVQPLPTGRGSEVIICQRLWLFGYWINVFISLVLSILLGCVVGRTVAGAAGVVVGILLTILLFTFALASVLLPFWLAVNSTRTLLVNLLLLRAVSQP